MISDDWTAEVFQILLERYDVTIEEIVAWKKRNIRGQWIYIRSDYKSQPGLGANVIADLAKWKFRTKE